MSEVRDENKSSTVNQLQSSEAEDDLHESLVQSKKIVRPKKSRTVCTSNKQPRKKTQQDIDLVRITTLRENRIKKV